MQSSDAIKPKHKKNEVVPLLHSSSDVVEVGVDEAGRGPLAFEVVAGAVIMPATFPADDPFVLQIKDSKKLSAKKRAILTEYIKTTAIAYGIGIATVEEINEHNILNATYMAMHRALDQVWTKHPFQCIKVDGDRFKAYCAPVLHSMEGWINHETVVNGDNTRLDIAAASIIAKHTHDTMVDDIVVKYPDLSDRYGFDTNKGYGTEKHIAGLNKYGPTSYHRRSFAPVYRSI